MTQNPTLSFWQIWNMSFGVLGSQFGFALQSGFMSRIFRTLGADTHALPLRWIAAPLDVPIVQPIVGYLSMRVHDRQRVQQHVVRPACDMRPARRATAMLPGVVRGRPASSATLTRSTPPGKSRVDVIGRVDASPPASGRPHPHGWCHIRSISAQHGTEFTLFPACA